MFVYENGQYREETAEEIAEREAIEANTHETLEERIATLEAELEAAKILLGVSE